MSNEGYERELKKAEKKRAKKETNKGRDKGLTFLGAYIFPRTFKERKGQGGREGNRGGKKEIK